MKPVIAQQGPWPYRDRMAATLFRMLALIALVMMPFGMTAAPAAAEAPHHAMMAMEPGHSDEGNGRDDAPSASQCALACSMVTSEPSAAPEPVEVVAVKPALPTIRTFVSHPPEADPPPPKLA